MSSTGTACRTSWSSSSEIAPSPFPGIWRPTCRSLRIHFAWRVLEELVRTDLELRWRQKQGVLIEKYIKHYPELSDPARLAGLLRDEYRLRQRLGDKPDLAEYRRRFPRPGAVACRA